MFSLTFFHSIKVTKSATLSTDSVDVYSTNEWKIWEIEKWIARPADTTKNFSSLLLLSLLCVHAHLQTNMHAMYERKPAWWLPTLRPLFWLCYRYCCAVWTTPLPCALFKFFAKATQICCWELFSALPYLFGQPNWDFPSLLFSRSTRWDRLFHYALHQLIESIAQHLYICMCVVVIISQMLKCSSTVAPSHHFQAPTVWCSLTHLLTCSLSFGCLLLHLSGAPLCGGVAFAANVVVIVNVA